MQRLLMMRRIHSTLIIMHHLMLIPRMMTLGNQISITSS